MNDVQELVDASITVSLVEAVGPMETITFKVAIYSNDPIVAILAPCGGSYVKRPADIRDMMTVAESDVRDKEDVPVPYDVYDIESDDCTFDFFLEGFLVDDGLAWLNQQTRNRIVLDSPGAWWTNDEENFYLTLVVKDQDTSTELFRLDFNAIIT